MFVYDEIDMMIVHGHRSYLCVVFYSCAWGTHCLLKFIIFEGYLRSFGSIYSKFREFGSRIEKLSIFSCLVIGQLNDVVSYFKF